MPNADRYSGTLSELELAPETSSAITNKSGFRSCGVWCIAACSICGYADMTSQIF